MSKHNTKKGAKIGDKLFQISYRVFKSPGESLNRRHLFKTDILKSNMQILPEVYASFVVFATALSVIAIPIALILPVSILFKLPMFAAPILVFLLTFSGPKVSQSNRSAGLERELPYLFDYMAILAGGGGSIVDNLRKISDNDIFKISSREIGVILKQIDVFGKDPITAIEYAAKYCPNKQFSEFLSGYSNTIKIGGSPDTYITGKLKEIMDAKIVKAKQSVDSVGNFAEAYLMLTSLLGITLFTIFQTEAFVNHQSSNITTLLLFSYVGVPLVSVAFIWVINGIIGDNPYVDMRPYKIMMYFMPVAAILVLPIPIPFLLKMGVTLIGISLVPGILEIRYAKFRVQSEARISDFLNDLAENRKLGMSPEIAIQNLGGSDYGLLTPMVRQLGAMISWGIDTKTVFQAFSDKLRTWSAKALSLLLFNTLESGGGTERNLRLLADFTKTLTTTATTRRSSLKLYIFLIYISAIVVVMIPFLLAYLTFIPTTIPNFSSSANTFTTPPGELDQLFAGTAFEVWVMGIVAGKMGGGSIADGLIHATILVIVTVVMVFVIGQFIPLAI
jgi:flagellar protein FlaJ